MLDYAAGLTVNQHLNSRNQASQNLNLEFQYRLTPHVSMRLLDTFYDTSGFFDQPNGNQNFLGVGVLQQPNESVLTPLAQQIGNLGTAEVDYQFSSNSAIGALGNSYYSHYKDAPAGFTLIDTQSEEALGFYSRRVSARNWVGVAYNFQHLTFQPGMNQTNVHSFLPFHTIYLQPKMTLSIFGGRSIRIHRIPS